MIIILKHIFTPQFLTFQKQSLLGQNFQVRAVDSRMQQKPENQTSTDDCLLNYSTFTDVCPCPFGYKTMRKTNACEEVGMIINVQYYNSLLHSLKGL